MESPSVNRITDVVPANFLCDNQLLSKIAESKLLDERALSTLDEELAVLERRLQRLKEETATVEQLITDVVARQTRLRQSVATHASLLSSSPVRSLPGEVLSEIFLHYIALSQPVTTTVFEEIVASHRIHTPILQVCRRWRTTALADPRLWTTIPLAGSGISGPVHPLISGSPEERTAYWQALERRIEHTSSLSLNILFHLSSAGVSGDPTHAIACFQTLVRLFPRANSLSIDLFTPSLDIPDLLSMINNVEFAQADHVLTARLHLLEKVFRRKILSAIPNVEVLEIEALDVDQWFLDTPNAGHQLRSLHLHNPLPLRDILNLLEHLPLLDTFRLCRVRVPSLNEDLRVVTHPLVSTFQIASAGRDHDFIFQHLTLPALRTLMCTAEPSYGNLSWPRPSTVHFLKRSGCALTELACLDYRISYADLSGILSVQNHITTLRLDVIPNSNTDGNTHQTISLDILDYLSAKPTGGLELRVPLLKVIWVSILVRQLKAVKRLIHLRSGEEARKYGFVELEEVLIHVCSKQTENEIKRVEHTAMFAPFVNAGVDVQISYGSPAL